VGRPDKEALAEGIKRSKPTAGGLAAAKKLLVKLLLPVYGI